MPLTGNVESRGDVREYMRVFMTYKKESEDVAFGHVVGFSIRNREA